MGYEAHNTIVVTSWKDEHIIEARAKAAELFGEQASAVLPAVTNGYRSFFIAPDGSKEGWQESNEGDKRRAAFLRWARSSGLYLDFVEVRFGGDVDAAEVVDGDTRLEPTP